MSDPSRTPAKGGDTSNPPNSPPVERPGLTETAGQETLPETEEFELDDIEEIEGKVFA